jgi:hypothetical protein
MHAEIGEAGKLEVPGKIGRKTLRWSFVLLAWLGLGLREEKKKKRLQSILVSYLILWLMSVPASAFTTHMLPNEGFGWRAHLT